MSKQQLMDAAEASGISRNPIHSKGGQVGVARPGAVQRFEYNGWSGFSDLKNKDPPYVVAYSNPVKIKLTPEVHAVARNFGWSHFH